jgi:hypothetical protein
MAIGPGYSDGQGFWFPGEADTETLFTSHTDRMQTSSSAAAVLDRARLSALEASRTEWVNYTCVRTNFNIGSGGSAAAVTQWRREGSLIRVFYKFVLGTTGFAIGANPTFTFPFAAAALPHPYAAYPGNGSAYDTSSGALAVTMVGADNASVTSFRIYSGAAYGAFSNTAPIAWAASDVAQGEFTYRAA